MIVTRRLLLLAALLALAVPGSALASERDAARAFADAARTYTQGVWQARPAIRAALDEAIVDRSACLGLKRTVQAIAVRKRATADERRLIGLIVARPIAIIEAPLLPAYRRFVATLDAVATNDRVLRSGRAAWRKEAGMVAAFLSLPADTCARLLAWDRGGRVGPPLPELDLRALDGLFVEFSSFAATQEDDGEVDPRSPAARRLRELGQGPRRAERFVGTFAERATDVFLDDLERDLLWIGPLLD